MGAFGRSYLQDRTSEPTRNEIIGATESLRLSLISDQPGIVEFLGSSRVLVSLHVGTSVAVDCHSGGQRHRGTTIHGDLEIIPTQLGGVWEIKSRDTALVIGLKLRILERIVEESGVDPGKLRIINRFQVRDAQIEHIGWALKAEMESGYPSGRSYMDALATALAARIVRNHSSLARTARSAGLSVSHFKTLFRRSMDVPPHQYLIRWRVEPAALQLRTGTIHWPSRSREWILPPEPPLATYPPRHGSNPTGAWTRLRKPSVQ